MNTTTDVVDTDPYAQLELRHFNDGGEAASNGPRGDIYYQGNLLIKTFPLIPHVVTPAGETRGELGGETRGETCGNTSGATCCETRGELGGEPRGETCGNTSGATCCETRGETCGNTSGATCGENRGGDGGGGDEIIVKNVPSGTILRLYALPTTIGIYNVPTTSTIWQLSTHRRIHAYQTSWSTSVSFGQQFESALHKQLYEHMAVDDVSAMNLFTQSLDSRYVYTFLLTHESTARIVPVPIGHSLNQIIYFIGKFEIGGGRYIEYDSNVLLPTLPTWTFSTWDLVNHHVNNLLPHQWKGVWHIDTASRLPIQLIYSKPFKRAEELRNNEPNILKRYIQIRSTPQVTEFCNLYSTSTADFNIFEDRIHKVLLGLCEAYVRIFVNREYIPIASREYRILKMYVDRKVVNRPLNICVQDLKRFVDQNFTADELMRL